jgi:hypothetical protein
VNGPSKPLMCDATSFSTPAATQDEEDSPSGAMRAPGAAHPSAKVVAGTRKAPHRTLARGGTCAAPPTARHLYEAHRTAGTWSSLSGGNRICDANTRSSCADAGHAPFVFPRRPSIIAAESPQFGGDARLPRDRSCRASALATRNGEHVAARREARFAGCVPKKALFLAPKSILLHHSATGWM